MRKFSAVLLALTWLLILPGQGVMAQNKILGDVNESCGTPIFTDCAGCHYGSGGLTPEQDIYLADGACGFCPDNATCSSAPPTRDELLADSRTTTNAYFETLFKLFIKAMKDTGMMDPDGTINNPNIFAEVFPACPEIAPIVASDYSRTTGYLVRRVTEKTRNSRNTPDDWERVQLRSFADSAARGDARTQFNITKPDGSILPTKEYESYDVVKEGSGRDSRYYFRYMRSITMPGLPTEPPHLPCLKCHGTFDQIGPGVAEAVQEFYPYDEAMGYKKGDIRGAWSVKIPLEERPR